MIRPLSPLLTPLLAPALAFCRAAERCARWAARRRERRVLVALSDRALHDLGISRADAWAEYDKPFWRS